MMVLSINRRFHAKRCFLWRSESNVGNVALPFRSSGLTKKTRLRVGT
jgi:hypothetical protein